MTERIWPKNLNMTKNWQRRKLTWWTWPKFKINIATTTNMSGWIWPKMENTINILYFQYLAKFNRLFSLLWYYFYIQTWLRALSIGFLFPGYRKRHNCHLAPYYLNSDKPFLTLSDQDRSPERDSNQGPLVATIGWEIACHLWPLGHHGRFKSTLFKC